MARLYFHCSNDRGTMIDRRGVDLGGLDDACDHAARVVRSLIASPSLEDWRSWVLHVWDDVGDEVFSMPFVSTLGKPH